MIASRRRELLVRLGPVLLLFISACQASPSPEEAQAGPFRQPQSSLAALVRALEVVDAVHDPRGYIRVRAVECDSILDRARRSEYARVLLDLTVYSRDVGTAQALFEDLARMLEDEADRPGRFDVVPRHRAERVFQAMNWDAESLPENALSYSDVLRLEMRRGKRPQLPSGAIEGASEGEPPSRPMREYVTRIAEGSAAGVGAVEIDLHVVHPIPGARDLRANIRPGSPDSFFTRDQIGAFLSELEAQSPMARVTRVAIQRAPHLPNWNEPEVWTFDAVLTLRQGTP